MNLVCQLSRWRGVLRALPIQTLRQLGQWLIPLLPVTPDVDRPSTFQARFSDRAGGCAGALDLRKLVSSAVRQAGGPVFGPD